MEKVWEFRTIEDGQTGASFILSHRDVARAIDWVAQGGKIEDLIRTEPVDFKVERAEQPADLKAAA